MPVPEITLVPLAGSDDHPVLLLGPSLGTSVQALWGACADILGSRYRVVGWELPGHGQGRPASEPFTMAELAVGVLAGVDRELGGGPFAYAGDSVGGAVGLQLALDAGERLTAVVPVCTAARIGTFESWADRAGLVRREGTTAVVDSSEQRWFGPGFIDRSPQVAAALLSSLREADAASYALVCDALGDFDIRDRMAEITVPLLAIGGALDVATPAADLRAAAGSVRGSRFVELDGVAHLAPAEDPERVCRLLRDWLADVEDSDPSAPGVGARPRR
jgi:3-oxoadipate enol-lactonase/4-carboxymuconolactone decarboxylase